MSTEESPSEAKKTKTMPELTEGVKFDTIAREWRCKWSPDNDKKSLQEAEKALEGILADVKSVDGCKSVQRIVCGECMDFKVITALPAEKMEGWQNKNYAPEAEFLGKLKAIDGLSQIETQTYTIMPM